MVHRTDLRTSESENVIFLLIKMQLIEIFILSKKSKSRDLLFPIHTQEK